MTAPTATEETTMLKKRHKAFMAAYNALWTLARPVLDRNPRLKQGLSQRVVPMLWALPCDIWIQAASGGEAYLAWEILKELPAEQERRILLTSCTQQGVDVLNEARDWCRANAPHLKIQTTFFPYDQSAKMRRAMVTAAPKLIVLLETELWPGMLQAAKEQQIPVVILNGRMTPRSFAGLLSMRGLLRALAPAKVLAISEHDAQRYRSLFHGSSEPGCCPCSVKESTAVSPAAVQGTADTGATNVSLMHNIKFDRVVLTDTPDDTPLLHTVIKPNTSLLTLGSVREEEEGQILTLIQQMQQARPKTSIALIPRHMHRVSAWEEHLRRAGIPYVRRSQTSTAPSAGTLFLWDTFGELNQVYALSRAVFVGGSLARLGGQNFLEPLAHGITPVIGPHYTNFLWAQGLIDDELVYPEQHLADVHERLLKVLKRPAPKERIQKRYTEWLASRKGGAQQAAGAILELLDADTVQARQATS